MCVCTSNLQTTYYLTHTPQYNNSPHACNNISSGNNLPLSQQLLLLQQQQQQQQQQSKDQITTAAGAGAEESSPMIQVSFTATVWCYSYPVILAPGAVRTRGGWLTMSHSYLPFFSLPGCQRFTSMLFVVI